MQITGQLINDHARRLRRWLGNETPPLPNFLILGASRSGSSTLHSWLGQHPEIYMSRPKELWFFNRDDRFALGLDYYRQQFRGWNGEPVRGETTPIYFYRKLLYHDRKNLYWSDDDGPISRIARSLPDAKFVLTLRHPLDRFNSQYRKNSRRGKVAIGPTLEAYARKVGVGAMEYREDLTHVIRTFGSHRLKILIFEEWTADPQPALQEIFRFLNLPCNIELDTSTIVTRTGNEGGIARKLARWTGMTDRSDEGSLTMNNCMYDEFHRALEPDVRFVETVLNRRIPLWRQPRNQVS